MTGETERRRGRKRRRTKRTRGSMLPSCHQNSYWAKPVFPDNTLVTEHVCTCTHCLTHLKSAPYYYMNEGKQRGGRERENVGLWASKLIYKMNKSRGFLLQYSWLYVQTLSQNVTTKLTEYGSRWDGVQWGVGVENMRMADLCRLEDVHPHRKREGDKQAYKHTCKQPHTHKQAHTWRVHSNMCVWHHT